MRGVALVAILALTIAMFAAPLALSSAQASEGEKGFVYRVDMHVVVTRYWKLIHYQGEVSGFGYVRLNKTGLGEYLVTASLSASQPKIVTYGSKEAYSEASFVLNMINDMASSSIRYLEVSNKTLVGVEAIKALTFDVHESVCYAALFSILRKFVEKFTIVDYARFMSAVHAGARFSEEVKVVSAYGIHAIVLYSNITGKASISDNDVYVSRKITLYVHPNLSVPLYADYVTTLKVVTEEATYDIKVEHTLALLNGDKVLEDIRYANIVEATLSNGMLKIVFTGNNMRVSASCSGNTINVLLEGDANSASLIVEADNATSIVKSMSVDDEPVNMTVASLYNGSNTAIYLVMFGEGKHKIVVKLANNVESIKVRKVESVTSQNPLTTYAIIAIVVAIPLAVACFAAKRFSRRSKL